MSVKETVPTLVVVPDIPSMKGGTLKVTTRILTIWREAHSSTNNWYGLIVGLSYLFGLLIYE